MGSVEDLRNVVPELIAPDLKALDARLTALERKVKGGFEQAEKTSQEHFAAVQDRFVAVLERLSSFEKLPGIRHEAVMSALEMEKRIARRARQWNRQGEAQPA